jgi:NTE family protein
MAIRGLDKIVRSVRAFGRSISGIPSSAPVSPIPSIGLALGGGFARGIVHVGVLKVLEQEGIPISFVAGTSVGALIGAAYCSGVSPAELEEIAARVRFKDLARWTLSRYGFATNMRMITFLNKILKVHTFEELQVPLAVTATDFGSGEGVVFRTGPLVDAVRASCAYPGVFLPVKVNGRLLVDGMLAHSLPTKPARDMGADKVLAVTLRSHWVNSDGPRHIFDSTGQVIEPDVTGYRYDDFERSAALVKIGEEATRAAMPAIRKWIEVEKATHPMPATTMNTSLEPFSPK